MNKDIYVLIKQRDGNIQNVSYELLGEAHSLAQDIGQKVVGILLGEHITEKAQDLIYYGADEVLVIDNPLLREYMTEPYTKALVTIIKEKNQRLFYLVLLLLVEI